MGRHQNARSDSHLLRDPAAHAHAQRGPFQRHGPRRSGDVGAQVASKGIAWLIWFLCTISANLAVVNFLPIPVVDGGLFTLLILEKNSGQAALIQRPADRPDGRPGADPGRVSAGDLSGFRPHGGLLIPGRVAADSDFFDRSRIVESLHQNRPLPVRPPTRT